MKINNKFVCAGKEYSEYTKAVAAPLFRKVIECDKTDGAYIEISAMGFYELYVNGEKITKGLLAPYISNPEHILYYDTYKLDGLLKKGKNTVCVILGNGFKSNCGGQIWDFDKAAYRGAPALSLYLFDGEREYTAEDFLWKRSAILFDDMRCGVMFDAGAWNGDELMGADSKGWQEPILSDGKAGELKAIFCEPIRVREELRAIEIVENSYIHYVPRGDVFKGECFIGAEDYEGGYLYDFGKNAAGTVRLKIRGKAGQKIVLRFGELREDDDLCLSTVNFYPPALVQMLYYICSGDGEETFEVPFTYYGARYCHIWGITPEQATKDLLTFLVASSDMQMLTSFECSSDDVNKIYSMCEVSDLSNFWYFPTDCPHREKNGWTGDASESSEHMLLHYGAQKSFSQWLQNIAKAQDEKGSLPGIVPTGGWGFEWGNGPAWDRVLFNLPYYNYKYTGEYSDVYELKDTMMRYIRYLCTRRGERGTLAIGLGDWCHIGMVQGRYCTPLEFTDTAIMYDICKKTSALFSVAGIGGEDKELVDALAKELRQNIRDAFLDTSDMSLAGGTQTAQAFGLEYGIFEKDEEKRAFDRLVEEIHKHDDFMYLGFLGARLIFQVLSRFGESELAFKMITRREAPSYGMLIDRGCTSLPEAFDSPAYTYDKTISYNHHFFADVSRWFFENILGISVNPSVTDANSVVISPCRVSSITYAKGERIMPDGKLSVFWTRNGSQIELEVRVEGDVHISFDFGELEATKLSENKFVIKV